MTTIQDNLLKSNLFWTKSLQNWPLDWFKVPEKRKWRFHLNQSKSNSWCCLTIGHRNWKKSLGYQVWAKTFRSFQSNLLLLIQMRLQATLHLLGRQLKNRPWIQVCEHSQDQGRLTDASSPPLDSSLTRVHWRTTSTSTLHDCNLDHHKPKSISYPNSWKPKTSL